MVVEKEATYLFYREYRGNKEPGIKIFRISHKGDYNVAYPEPEVIEGDVNGDNFVDVADIANIIYVMAGDGQSSIVDGQSSAYINHDGVVDVADIATVITIMAGE